MKKRLFSLLLLFCMTAGLLGCSLLRTAQEDKVTFYYARREYRFGAPDGVTASELRDLSGHTEDLTFLLKVYLLGPQDNSLSAPFPQNTRLLSAEETEGSAVITLSDTGTPMTEMEFTIGCACLAQTYMEWSGAEQITVNHGSKSITLNRSGLLFFDRSSSGQITVKPE